VPGISNTRISNQWNSGNKKVWPLKRYKNNPKGMKEKIELGTGRTKEKKEKQLEGAVFSMEVMAKTYRTSLEKPIKPRKTKISAH